MSPASFPNGAGSGFNLAVPSISLPEVPNRSMSSMVAHTYLARNRGKPTGAMPFDLSLPAAGRNDRLSWRSNEISWEPSTPMLRQLDACDDERYADSSTEAQADTTGKRCVLL